MGTHPIFESDFDCLTECSQGRSFPAARRYSDPSENARPGHGNWVYTGEDAGWDMHERSKKEYLDKLKDIDGWYAEIQAGSKANAKLYEERKKANRWTPGPYAPKSWVTENIYEANYFWPRPLKHTVSRYKDVNLAHKTYEEANILKYHILFLKVGLFLALVLEMPPIMINVWKENRA